MDLRTAATSAPSLPETAGRLLPPADALAFVEAAAVPVHFIAADGTLLWANKAELDFLGYTAEEYFGRNIRDFHVHPATDEAILCRLVAGDTVRSQQVCLRHRDGSVRWGAVSSNGEWRDGRLAYTTCFTADVTAQKQAEEALAASEAMYRSLVETQVELVCRFDIDGTILFANDAYARAFGSTPSRLVGTSLYALIPESERGRVRGMLGRLSRECPEVRTEHYAVTSAGERWTAWTNRAITFRADGMATQAQSSGVDITDRRQAEEALRASEQRLRESEAMLRAFHDNSPVCMGVTELVDDDRDVLHVFDNPATCRFFAVPDGATAGRRARAELNADPRVIGHWIAAYRESEATGASVRFEHDYPTASGTRWLSATVLAIGKGASGRTRFCYVAEDVTERRQADAALRDSEHRLRLALEAGKMGTWEWHFPTGRVTWSPGLEAIHGYEPGGFAGTAEAYRAEIYPEDRQHVEKVIADSIAGKDHILEYRIVRRDGEVRWVEGRGKLFRDSEGNPVRLVGVCADVTLRKKAEASLRESEERYRTLAEALRDADRRKDEFLATLAHELRNPLAPLRTGVELLQRLTSDRGDVAAACAMMERQLGHVVRLIDDLLDVSRITRGKLALQKSVVDISKVLQDAIETSRAALASQQQRLSMSLAPEGVHIDADATRLSQVFSNLLHNASKFSPPGATVDVHVERAGTHVVVEVSDTGIGIDEPMLERIFDLFTQVEDPLHKTQPGLGIGLTLARQLVELHGGTLTAASEGLGKGATFRVRLPTIANPALTAPVHRERKAASRALRVLVADDNVDGALTLRDLLTLDSHEVRVVHGGHDALREAAVFRPEVVLLDIGMPDLDGYEVCKRMRARPDEPKLIVALTGWGQDEDRARARDAGFDEHLVKPPDPEQLRSLLDEASRR